MPVTIRYDEGAEVGHRCFARRGETPLYAFGHGLSYTSFEYRDLELAGGGTVTARFTVTNTGERAGADVPQLYLTAVGGEQRMRLLAFERVELEPGGVAPPDPDGRAAAAGALRRTLARRRRPPPGRGGQGRRRAPPHRRDESGRGAVRRLTARRQPGLTSSRGAPQCAS
jgi:hypothetical protein